MNKALRTVLLIAVFLAFVSTISYCSAPFDTESAQKISVRKTIGGEGYILRKETVIEQSSKGAFEPTIQNGVRVSKGSSLGVTITGNFNEELLARLEDVTKRIEEIKQSDNFANIYASDEARIFSALKDISASIREDVRREDYISATESTSQLNTLLQKKYSAENPGAAEELLISLEQDKYELEQKLGGIREEVKASASGYYYSELDGLETKATEEELFALTPAKIGDFSSKLEEYTSDEKDVGKIVDTYIWYLAAVLPEEEARNLTVGNSVTVSVDGSAYVKAAVAAINSDKSDQCAVILKCTRNVDDVFEKRMVEFDICYEEYQGLYVPSAAIRVVDDVTGVYVISQNEAVSFRCVDILLQEEDYYVVRSNYTPPESVKYSPLKIYDDILVNPEAAKDYEPEK